MPIKTNTQIVCFSPENNSMWDQEHKENFKLIQEENVCLIFACYIDESAHSIASFHKLGNHHANHITLLGYWLRL